MARTRRSLIDSKARGELPVGAYLYRVQHHYSKVLTIIANEIVRRPFLPHIVDDHLA